MLRTKVLRCFFFTSLGAQTLKTAIQVLFIKPQMSKAAKLIS